MKTPRYEYVTLAFGPPPDPLRDPASIWHAVHWNKAREMMTPHGFAEAPGSAQILGGGSGSVISFEIQGPARIPQPVQDWLQEDQPNGWRIATKIAATAAKFLAIIARATGAPTAVTTGIDVAQEIIGELPR